MSSKNDSITEDTLYHKVEKPETKNLKDKYKIDTIKHRYPYCIVWTPIPFVTCFFPFVGHIGICESNGIIHDFGGSYNISIDNMTFGFPTKIVLLKLTEKEFDKYDKAIFDATDQYNKMSYNCLTNNCHSFVAQVLNNFEYKGKNDYTINDVFGMVITKSKYLSWTDMFKSYSGFIVILIMILIIYYLIKYNL